MKVAKSITLEAVAKLFQGFGTVVVLDMLLGFNARC